MRVEPGEEILILYKAARLGHSDIVRYILDCGCPVDTLLTSSSSSALTLASEWGHLEVAKVLIDRGAKVDHVDGLGYTPLMYTASFGHLEIAKLFLRHSADVNLKTPPPASTTALMMASSAHRPNNSMINLLLEWGADERAQDGNGQTAAAMFNSKLEHTLISSQTNTSTQ